VKRLRLMGSSECFFSVLVVGDLFCGVRCGRSLLPNEAGTLRTLSPAAEMKSLAAMSDINDSRDQPRPVAEGRKKFNEFHRF